MAAVIGSVLYLGTTVVVLDPHELGDVKLASEILPSPDQDPSWKFRNPELDQWIQEVKREKEALAVREQELRELETRLLAERQELAYVTQVVHQLQMEFDRNVVRVKEQEVENLKRQAKLISGMSPEGAAAMLAEMPNENVARVLFVTKPDVVSPILEALSKVGKGEAKRAAEITELMSRALPPPSAAASP